MIYYLFAIIISIILFFFMYIRTKHPFWSIQPVFHFYDFYYWLYNIGIIDHDLPEKNRYTNFKNIVTLTKETLPEYQLSKFTHFIQSHYLKNGENVFMPKKENILPYFLGHNTTCFFSFYNEPILLQNNEKNIVVNDTKIISVMTTRPLHVTIQNENKSEEITVYYVDYLCVDNQYRKKNIAPQMIQTHHYHQSRQNKDISVSLFKREGELTGIIPLTAYHSYCYNMKNWNSLSIIPPTMNLLVGNKENIYYLYDFIKTNTKKWNITILPEMTNVMELISSKNIYVIMILKNNEIQCAYLFRKLCTFIEKNKEIISCIGSIKGLNISEDDFIYYFKLSLSHIIQKIHVFHYLNIEDISDNHIFIQNISMRTTPMIISPTAYFFYNFAYQPFHSHKVFILN